MKRAQPQLHPSALRKRRFDNKEISNGTTGKDNDGKRRAVFFAPCAFVRSGRHADRPGRGDHQLRGVRAAKKRRDAARARGALSVHRPAASGCVRSVLRLYAGTVAAGTCVLSGILRAARYLRKPRLRRDRAAFRGFEARGEAPRRRHVQAGIFRREDHGALRPCEIF